MRCADWSAIAPSVVADADDTAKVLLTLNLLGKATNPEQMIYHFKSENGHFRTYPGETDASFSANCNILIALTHMSNVEDYSSSISSIVAFLSETWWNGTPKDKWVRSGEFGTLQHETDCR